jgi:hypothetical protein
VIDKYLVTVTDKGVVVKQFEVIAGDNSVAYEMAEQQANETVGQYDKVELKYVGQA